MNCRVVGGTFKKTPSGGLHLDKATVFFDEESKTSGDIFQLLRFCFPEFDWDGETLQRHRVTNCTFRPEIPIRENE
jgi:hypothetical protein